MPERRSPSSTATRGSCATAATRSSSSPSQSTFLEVAYLLLEGELPTRADLNAWTTRSRHTFVHENIKRLIEGFRYDAHPMGMISTVGALSSFYPEAASRRESRLAADRPADRQDADARRLVVPAPPGHPYVYPDNDLALRQLPVDGVRWSEPTYSAEPGARARARRAVHPARRPRAELLDQRDARGRLGRSIPTPRSRRGGGALRAAPRRRERGGAADAPEIGDVKNVPRSSSG